MFHKNIAKLNSLLPPLRQNGIQNIINGQKVAANSGEQFNNHSPIDNEFICRVAKSDSTDIDKAAKIAKAAFKTWRNLSPQKRKKILYAIADKIEKHAHEIAVLESYDTGQPILFVKNAAQRGASDFRFYADRIIDAPTGKSLPDHTNMTFTIRQPIGAVGVITAWNVPFTLATAKIAPALATGCTVVHKPAELSPVTSNYLAELAHEAGLPKGVWNVVHGLGGTAGKALTEHEDIKAIAFVGESLTGSEIMRQGATTLKRVQFELGGKNPIIIFPDANLERALDAVILMKFSLNGQRCTSCSRCFIHQSIYADFNKKLTERIAKIKVGNPLDPTTEIGALIDEKQQAKVLNYIKIGVEEGAVLAVGGTKPDIKGCYVNPTLFVDVKPEMRIAQEEVFGPFLTTFSFETEAEVIEKANAVKYGLTAYIWTKDIMRATRMAKEIESGGVWINTPKTRHLLAPFGGVKHSGIGREGGDYSFDFYTETKSITIAFEETPIMKLGN